MSTNNLQLVSYFTPTTNDTISFGIPGVTPVITTNPTFTFPLITDSNGNVFSNYFNQKNSITIPGFGEFDKTNKDSVKALLLFLMSNKRLDGEVWNGGRWKADGKWLDKGETARELDRYLQNIKSNKLAKKSSNSQNPSKNNIAYVNFIGYNAYGIIPTGHAGLLVKDNSNNVYYYDYGSKGGKRIKTLGVSKNDGNDYRSISLGKMKNGLTLLDFANNLFDYFDNNEIEITEEYGDPQKAILYFVDKANNPDRKGYSINSNNCSTEAKNAFNVALGKNPDNSLFNFPGNNAPSGTKIKLVRQEQSSQDTDNYIDQAEAYKKELEGLTPDEIIQKALNKSRTTSTPYTYFGYAKNLSQEKRQQASRNTAGNISNCINTVTSFYDPTNTVSSTKAFANNPKLYGFKEIENPNPGDIAVLFDNEQAYHAGIVDAIENGKIYLNYSNGSNLYKKHRPITVFDAPNQKHKRTNTKYYRYIGNPAAEWRLQLNHDYVRFFG